MVLTTFKDSLNELLKNGALWIALAIVALIIITVLFLVIRGRKTK